MFRPQKPSSDLAIIRLSPLCHQREKRCGHGKIMGLLGTLVLGFAFVAPSGGCRFASNGQNALGTQLYEQGQYTAALQQFQKALNNDPQNPDAYYNLAATTHRLGVQRGQTELINQAEALYNQCLDFDPNHVECHRALAVLLADTGRPDRAFALMKNWAAQNPQFAEPRIELARLYEEAGDPAQALKYLEDAVRQDANNARAWLALGRLREQSGDLVQALQNYERSLALNNLQPMAAERVAALGRQISANYDATMSGAATQIATQTNFNSGFIRR
ncbi:MAG: tetratricopeptide repeat protein [Pirellulales bacterium]|nr:tetratricopeptide repeat protein [Pirellulales bacterium]